MKRWWLDSCACIIDYSDPTDVTTFVFVEQCRTHDRTSETLAHNRSFSKESQIDLRVLERKKPEFQRR